MVKLSRRKLLELGAAGATAGIASLYSRGARAVETIPIAGIHDASGGIDIYGRSIVSR
jgi:urea transport system substrate-binding protein